MSGSKGRATHPTPPALSFTLERGGSKPLYNQLSDALRLQIESGQWREGTKLPTERALCTMSGVSRITVRHAISQMEREGLITRIQGLGTFVASRKYEQPLTEVHSFEQAIRQLGYSPSTQIHRSTTLVGELMLTAALQLDPGETVASLQLIGSGDGTPIVFYDSYFALELGTSILALAAENERDHRPFSTLDLYRNLSDVEPTRAEQTFESAVADHALGELLNVKEGWPILTVTSIIHGQSGPLEYRRAFYRGDKYKFVVQRDLAGGFVT